MSRDRPDPAAWARVSDDELAQRDAENLERETQAQATETSSSAPIGIGPPLGAPGDEPLDADVVQIKILSELQAIRFRLGVLVWFLVIIPIAVGFIVGFAIGLD